MSSNHTPENKDNSLKIGIVLNGAYAILGFVLGVATGSLALIADATHNLTDNFTLGVSYTANRIARRDANDSKTFGYGRATILAALLNASFMVALALFVAYEAIGRLRNPVEIEGGIVAAVAFIGILVNAFIAYRLSKNRTDLNMRSAYIDQLFDTLSSIGTVIAGLIMAFTDIPYVDSIVALLIVGLLLYNTIQILREAVQILLEGTPKDLDLKSVIGVIQDTPKVIQVDDMHVWAIRSGYNALSCHIVIDEKELPNSRKIVEMVKETLRVDCNIHHATIEVELEDSHKDRRHEHH